MAYCVKCGAYMPDSAEKCLACGYSEAAAQAESRAEQEREAAEERRRAQQQQAEKWAKEEKERRDKASQDEGWTRVSYDAAKSNSGRQDADYYINKIKQAGGTAGEYFYKAEEKMKSAGIDKTKALAALSYLSFLWVLPYIFCSGDEFALFHAKQGLILFLCNCLIDLIGFAAPVMWALKIVSLLLMLVGFKNALTGERKRLPFIGNILK